MNKLLSNTTRLWKKPVICGKNTARIYSRRCEVHKLVILCMNDSCIIDGETTQRLLGLNKSTCVLPVVCESVKEATALKAAIATGTKAVVFQPLTVGPIVSIAASSLWQEIIKLAEETYDREGVFFSQTEVVPVRGINAHVAEVIIAYLQQPLKLR